MSGRGEREAARRPIVYCVVPRELAGRLHESLRRHFREDPGVEVIVERRTAERRQARDRRATPAEARAYERRRVGGSAGRRVGERRVSPVPVEAPPLPRRAQRHADRLSFVERLEPSGQHAEDVDTDRLVTRVQAGDRSAFAEIYMRYFDRIFGYLLVVLSDTQTAEDGAQEVFVNALEAVPRYERRGQPFRAWLFRIARNHAIDELRRQNRFEPADPHELSRRREGESAEVVDVPALDWLSDRELVLFIERLPLAQRQVLMLRYTADLSDVEIAAMLGRTPVDVRMLQSRALRFLRERLTAIGRGSGRRDRIRMRRQPREATVIRARRWALGG